MPEIGDTRRPGQPGPIGFRRIPSPEEAVKVEALLKRHEIRYSPGIEGTCLSVPLKFINRKGSQHIQARKDRIVDDSIYRIKIAYQAALNGDGPWPPPVILFKDTENSKLLKAADGNNRIESAFQLGMEEIPAYIIATDTEEWKILALMMAGNNEHGVTPDLDWRLSQGLNLLAKAPKEISMEYITRTSAITGRDFQVFRKLVDFDERAKPLKIADWHTLHPKIRYKLGQIPSNRVLYNAAQCAISTKMNQKDTSDMVRDIKALHDEEAQYQYVTDLTKKRKAKIAADAKKGNGRKISFGPVHQLNAALANVMSVKAGDLAQVLVKESDRQTLLEQLYACGDYILQHLTTALEQVIGTPDEDDENDG